MEEAAAWLTSAVQLLQLQVLVTKNSTADDVISHPMSKQQHTC